MGKIFTGNLCVAVATLSMLLVFVDSYGQELDRIKDKDAVKVSGNFSLVNAFYHAWGIENRRPPYYWLFNGNINISLYGIDIPVSASISQQQRQFVQPFNQYGLSPSYKSVTLHGGYRTMHFSELTLGSNVFLGGGVEYAPSNLPVKISAMRGRLIAPTPPGTYRNGVEIPPTYKRMGQGIRLTGYRKGDQLDLTIFSAKDDPSSINLTPGDSNSYFITPEENAVIELSLRKRISQKVSLEIKYAQSLYNLDSRSPETEGQALINQVLSPLMKTNASTLNNKAIISRLSYSGEQYNVYLNYRRIDPEYKSMGSVFLTNDLEDIGAGVNFSMLKNKINLDLNGGIQYNNLNEDKLSQMKRIIGGANIFWNINEKSNLSVNYSNFSSSTVYSAFSTMDSLNYVQVTQNAGIAFNHSFSRELKSSLFIQGNLQRLTDTNSNDADFYNFSSGYQTMLNAIFSCNTAINYTNNSSGDLITNSVGPSLSFSGQKSKKFKASASVVWLYAYTNGKISNKYKTYSLNINHPQGKHRNLSVRVSFLDRTRVSEQNNHINELRAEINYSYTF